MTTDCSQCCKEIDENEVQFCEWCGRDGLGNCCIGDLDHRTIDGDNCPGADGRGP